MNYFKVVSLDQEEIQRFTVGKFKPDIIEIRLDLISPEFIKTKLISLLENLKYKFIFTFRLPEDSSLKSNFNFNPEIFEELLNKFNTKENYLDIELDKKNSYLEPYYKLEFSKIYSMHRFDKTISLKEMKEYINKKEGIFKFAANPQNLREIYDFLNSILELSKTNQIIGIAMGEKGKISRVIGDKFGSLFTYSCLNEPKAPGQISIEKLESLRNRLLPIPDTISFETFQELEEICSK